MTVRVIVAAAVFVVAAAIAWRLERGRRAGPPARGRAVVPEQIDRRDFPRADAPWLVLLFTSVHCDSCEGLYDKASPLESADVAVTEVEYTKERDIHRRYSIEAAPVTVIADADGVTRASFIGSFDASDLWARLAELRDTSPHGS